MSVSYPSLGDRVRITLPGDIFNMTGIVENIDEPKEQGKLTMFAIRVPGMKRAYWMRRSDFTIIGEA